MKEDVTVVVCVIVTVTMIALFNNLSIRSRHNEGFVGDEDPQEMQDYYSQFDQKGRFVDGTVVVSPDEADELGVSSGLGWVN